MPTDHFKHNQYAAGAAARALYVHVPFCLAKCRYCDFYSRPIDASSAQGFVNAVAAELGLRRDALQPPLESIYVGGGTPSSLEPAMLGRLLGLLSPLAGPDTEFTVEANPGVLDADRAAAMAAAGVNRVSLGAQSFQQAELELLGRLHRVQEVPTAVALLRGAGITNLCLDLIYGIPGQTPESWGDSLERVIELDVQHVSCYALSFEGGTPLHRQLSEGLVAAMPDELQEQCYRTAIDRLGRAGFEHYEISNWAKPGKWSRHNCTYWRNLPYLGLGPAAASYVGGVRWVNQPDLEAYVAALSSGSLPPAEREKLENRPQMAETLMLGLRLLEGVDRAEFASRFGLDPLDAFPHSLSNHRGLGTVIITDTHLRLSDRALFVSDSVLADIIAEV